MVKITALIFFLAGSLISLSGAEEKGGDLNFNKIVVDLMTQRKIAAFYIYYIPNKIAYVTAVTPTELKSEYRYKLEVKHIYPKNPIIQSFLSSVGTVSFIKENINFDFDCRWGFVFVDKNGEELASIFCDPFFNKGRINGNPFIPDKKLTLWVRENLKSFNSTEE